MSDWLSPYVEDDTGEFWSGTAAGELRLQACVECDRFRFPPRPMCPRCRTTGRYWEAVAGRGTIWSFVVPHPPLLPAYAALAPYNVVVVSVEVDPERVVTPIRMIGNLVTGADGAINEIDPSSIEIGMPVEVVFPPPIDGFVLPRWTPAR